MDLLQKADKMVQKANKNMSTANNKTERELAFENKKLQS